MSWWIAFRDYEEVRRGVIPSFDYLLTSSDYRKSGRRVKHESAFHPLFMHVCASRIYGIEKFRIPNRRCGSTPESPGRAPLVDGANRGPIKRGPVNRAAKGDPHKSTSLAWPEGFTGDDPADSPDPATCPKYGTRESPTLSPGQAHVPLTRMVGSRAPREHRYSARRVRIRG